MFRIQVTSEKSRRREVNVRCLVCVFRQDLDAPDGRSIVSNPVAAYDVNNQTNVFCLCDDGQVYYRVQMLKEVTEFGKWQAIGSKLPFEEGFFGDLLLS